MIAKGLIITFKHILQALLTSRILMFDFVDKKKIGRNECGFRSFSRIKPINSAEQRFGEQEWFEKSLAEVLA